MNDPILHTFVSRSRQVSPSIQTIYLFGSRAQGRERPDSDYDLLLVVTDDFTLQEKDALYGIVMDLLLDTGRLVSLKIFKVSEFRRLWDLPTPFMRHIAEAGVQVG